MTRRRWVPFVLVAGAAALVHNAVYLSRELGGGTRPPSAETEEEEATEEPGVEEAAQSRPLEAVHPEEIRTYLAGLPEHARSPFMTRNEADGLVGRVDSSLPRVAGTLWSSGRRVAWIDGVPRSEGEVVRGFEVEQIGPGSVRVRRGGEALELGIEPPAPPEAPFEETDHVE